MDLARAPLRVQTTEDKYQSTVAERRGASSLLTLFRGGNL
jgi:hypothetical protein